MKKVLIVGGGIGGLTAMHFLTRQGLDVHLVEKSSSFRPEGAGIMLGINAMKLLAELGLADEIIASGQALDAFSMVDHRGRLIAASDARYMESETGYKTVAIHRRALQNILSKDLDKTNIRFNCSLTQLTQKDSTVHASINHSVPENFDLVIAADGIHSLTRTLLGLPSKLRYAGYTCWRFVIERPEVLSIDKGYEYWGRGRRFGVVPLGDNQLYCFATVNAQENEDQYKNISLAEFKRVFSEFKGVVPDILNTLTDKDELIHGDLRDQLAIRLQHKHAALLGDAAHAATPNMGQGAGMAIEDAYILAKMLASESNLITALTAYEKRRIARVRLIRDRSYKVGKIAQWEVSWTRATRNAMLRMMPSQGLSKDLCELLLDY